MNLDNVPLGITDWPQLPESVYPGKSDIATMRVRQFGDIRLRVVVYSANYVADHWCRNGHILFVVSGQLIIEHQQSLTYALMPGTNYHVGDDDAPPHRVLSENEATIFIVD